MDNTNIDFRELTILREIWRLKSVSAAAQELGISQPSASHALRKLRSHFSDRLFIRTFEGMNPTPLTDELMLEMGDSLAQISGALRYRQEFDPKRVNRVYTIIMIDMGEVVFLPRLLQFLQKEAPGITIRTRRMPTDAIPRALESGAVDLAIGYMPDLKAGVYQQRLFTTTRIGIVRKDHPEIGEKLTRQQFLKCSQVVADAEGTGHYIVERRLAGLGAKPIVLRTSSFLALPAIVASSNLLAVVPRPLLDASSLPIRGVNLPVKFPALEIKQFWHECYDNDPSNRWLRNCCAKLFQK
ncbi:MAG: LysR family transcriptional regulator [Pseudomonadota bacterium]